MASPNVVDSTQELLDAQSHIWNHIFSYVNSMSLNCMIQLGIPDAIHRHGKPITLPQLARALSVNEAKSDSLFRLMRILVHSKFFNKIKNEDEDEEEAYSLTRASRLFVKEEPSSFAPYALAMIDPIMVDPYRNLSEWLRNNSPSPFATKHGKDLWEFGRDDERWNRRFNEAMASDAVFVGKMLVEECKEVFEGLGSLVDVAGGTGAVAKAVADAFPDVKCVVLDLPQVVAGLEGYENLSYVSGDMFEFIPHADAVFLKRILHDWSDEDCIKILKKCKEAITPSKNSGKKVIIVEIVVDEESEDHKATETQLFYDLHLMVQVAGKQRTEKEWAKLFADAGFHRYKITPVLGLRSVIEVFV